MQPKTSKNNNDKNMKTINHFINKAYKFAELKIHGVPGVGVG